MHIAASRVWLRRVGSILTALSLGFALAGSLEVYSLPAAVTIDVPSVGISGAVKGEGLWVATAVPAGTHEVIARSGGVETRVRVTVTAGRIARVAFNLLRDPAEVWTDAPAEPGVEIVAIAAGDEMSYAVLSDGRVASWGRNQRGQLGLSGSARVPTLVPGLDRVVDVAAGYGHALFLRADGSVWALGWNGSGQLGDGTRDDRSQPVRVAGLTDAVAIRSRIHVLAHAPTPCSSPAAVATGANHTLAPASASPPREAPLLAEARVPRAFATVRSDVFATADAARLARIDGVEPVVCDVTDDEHVARLRAAIDARGAGLWGIVHNAGIAHLGHLTTTSQGDMRAVFEVNVFGVHRVTNALVDLIVASRGRIVTISSLSGTLSSTQLGAYSMSKHAIEAYTDALAKQLAPLGVHVCAVAPGNYASAIARNAVGRFAPPPDASEDLAPCTHRAPTCRARSSPVPNPSRPRATRRCSTRRRWSATWSYPSPTRRTPSSARRRTSGRASTRRRRMRGRASGSSPRST
jgi:NAD(P)-dependent dehydrogenase (short-subunit alcohol dehydrogenase family)